MIKEERTIHTNTFLHKSTYTPKQKHHIHLLYRYFDYKKEDKITTNNTVTKKYLYYLLI